MPVIRQRTGNDSPPPSGGYGSALAAFRTVIGDEQAPSAPVRSARPGSGRSRAAEWYGPDNVFHGKVRVSLAQCAAALTRPATGSDRVAPFDVNRAAQAIRQTAVRVNGFDPARHAGAAGVYSDRSRMLAARVAAPGTGARDYFQHSGEHVGLNDDVRGLLSSVERDLRTSPQLHAR